MKQRSNLQTSRDRNVSGLLKDTCGRLGQVEVELPQKYSLASGSMTQKSEDNHWKASSFVVQVSYTMQAYTKLDSLKFTV